MKEITKSVPEEVIEFLQHDGGSSLMVKGTAGTGKTTISLQLIEEMGDPDKSFYLSTRVSDESLYKQFPWLEEKEMKKQIIDSSKVFLETLYKSEEKEEEEELPEAEKEKIESAKEFLGSIEESGPPEEVTRTRLNEMDKRVPWLERIYDRVDSVLPERPMLVIDSVEGITHKYNMNVEEFLMALQKDLVEESNTNLILVMEREEAQELEYLVDGVVNLNRYQMENRDVREIQLVKLRSVGIRQPSYLMTLNGGRSRCFHAFYEDKPQEIKWEPVDDPEGMFSTGIKDMDDLLGGGFERGSYNVFEVKEDVSTEEYMNVIRPILLNFLTHDRGILAILSGGTHADNLRNDLTKHVNVDRFDEKFRIVDYFTPSSDKPYMMALGGKSPDELGQIYNQNITEIKGEENKPILDYAGFDTLEYLRGDEIAIKELLEAVANTKVTNNLGIGITKHGLKLSSEIKNMADAYFVISSINNTPCLYGVKPKTGLYAVVPDEEKGSPHIQLIPIV